MVDHDHRAEGCAKYLGLDGEPTRMYNTPALLAPTRSLIVTEGELDAATVDMCGWPAVGIPGADSWHAHFPRVVAGFEHIIVPADGDEAGRKFAKKVASSVPDCRVIALPPGEDVNSIFIRNGRDGLERMLMSNDE
jgi:DNA primase